MSTGPVAAEPPDRTPRGCDLSAHVPEGRLAGKVALVVGGGQTPVMLGLMDAPMAVDALAGALGVDRAVVSERRDQLVPLGGRQGTADDVANAVLFLAADEARFVTAAIVPVDGGQSARIG